LPWSESGQICCHRHLACVISELAECLGFLSHVMCSMCMHAVRAAQVPADIRQASHRPSRPGASSRRSHHSWTHTHLVNPRLALRTPLRLDVVVRQSCSAVPVRGRACTLSKARLWPGEGITSTGARLSAGARTPACPRRACRRRARGSRTWAAPRAPAAQGPRRPGPAPRACTSRPASRSTGRASGAQLAAVCPGAADGLPSAGPRLRHRQLCRAP